jgi:hypothetical protein
MKYFREILAYSFYGLWAYMVYQNPHEPLIVGAMITVVSGSIVSFYYGANKTGEATATKNADIVKALNTSNATPLPVTVENKASDPIPVESK